MARLSINLDSENDAFADDAIGETVRILNGIIHDLVINQPDYAKKIYDINGNNCGSWQWFAPEEHGCERCDDATAAINQRIQDGSDSESSLRDRYDIYTHCAPEPHKSFDEWLDS